MNSDIKQIAERLKGLRDALDLDTADVSRDCGIDEADYIRLESGEADIPVTFLIRLASVYKIELTTLLTGEAPRMHGYSITRKGQGTRVERRIEYHYQALNEGFIHKKATPFMVTLDGSQTGNKVPAYSHEGQEFNLVLEGRMKFVINNRELVLEEGDSIWFDSGLPHGMVPLDGKRVNFLAIIF